MFKIKRKREIRLYRKELDIDLARNAIRHYPFVFPPVPSPSSYINFTNLIVIIALYSFP